MASAKTPTFDQLFDSAWLSLHRRVAEMKRQEREGESEEDKKESKSAWLSLHRRVAHLKRQDREAESEEDKKERLHRFLYLLGSEHIDDLEKIKRAKKAAGDLECAKSEGSGSAPSKGESAAADLESKVEA